MHLVSEFALPNKRINTTRKGLSYEKRRIARALCATRSLDACRVRSLWRMPRRRAIRFPYVGVRAASAQSVTGGVNPENPSTLSECPAWRSGPFVLRSTKGSRSPRRVVSVRSARIAEFQGGGGRFVGMERSDRGVRRGPRGSRGEPVRCHRIGRAVRLAAGRGRRCAVSASEQPYRADCGRGCRPDARAQPLILVRSTDRC